MKDLGDITNWYDQYIEARESGRLNADLSEFKNINAVPLKPSVSLGVRTWNSIAQDNELVAIGKRAVRFWTLGRDRYADKYGQEKTDDEELITRKFFYFGTWVTWKNRSLGFGPLNFRYLVDTGEKNFRWAPVHGDEEVAFKEILLNSVWFEGGR